MRLLNTITRNLEEFDMPPSMYAILSHRWLTKEVTFQDMNRSDVKRLEGHAKLSAACDRALSLGFRYLWMDTCCIDKSSSSELSEAINSMYAWYKAATLCIVYLNDIHRSSWRENLGRSKWFTRGWTLQELIAPSELLFVDQDWETIGMKKELAGCLADITGIDRRVLLTGNMEKISIATKMSWASRRETTRPEDTAYSLMGIFDVNMPTIYGEGTKAFVRLQEEIMKKSNDQSIFAWSEQPDLQSTYNRSASQDRHHLAYNFLSIDKLHALGQYTGFLAPSPRVFHGMHSITRVSSVRLKDNSHIREHGLDADFMVTNCGIRICLPFQTISGRLDTCVAFLACGRPDKSTIFAVYLRQISDHRYIRLRSNNPGVQPDLLEIPINAIVRSSIQARVSLFVDALYKEHIEQRITQGSVFIDIASLCDVLQTRRYAIFDESWDQLSRKSVLLSDMQQESFLIVENEFKQMEFMLVISSNSGIGMRIITFGSNGVIPGLTRRQSPRDIYGTWRKRATGVDDLSPSSGFSVIRMSDGQEIAFMMVDATSARSEDGSKPSRRWRLLAVPRTCGEEERTLNPA